MNSWLSCLDRVSIFEQLAIITHIRKICSKETLEYDRILLETTIVDTIGKILAAVSSE